MHKSDKTYIKWFEAAYLLFAEKGPSEINVKAVADKGGLVRSNFYYYRD